MASEPAFPVLATQRDPKYFIVRMLGTGADVPTKQVGHNITLSRTAQGVIKLTWSGNPGTFLGIVGWAFGDTTPGDVKGYTLTRDTPVAFASDTAASLELSFWDSSFAAVDLTTTSYLDITIAFAADDDD